MLRTFISCLFVGIVLMGCESNSNQNTERSVFRYNQASGLQTLDPAFAKDQSTIWACKQLFNSLVRFNDSLQIEPDLALNWSVSEDARTYTFNLRSDVYFHQTESVPSRKLIAADVVYSFNRLLDPKVASPGRWIFDGRVIDNEPFKALNDTTVQITLKQSFPAFLGLLAMQYCSVVPKEAIDHFGKDFRSNPVGTGPFQFKVWKEGVALILKKNDRYFEVDENGKSLPYLDGVKITFIESKRTEFLAFKKGDVDFISGLDVSYADELLTEQGTLSADLSNQFILQKSPYLNTEYLGFNMERVKNRPLGQKKVRQAMNYAIDRQAMIQFLRNGIGIPANGGFIPKGLPGYIEDGFQFDLDKAKLLLQEAGYPNGEGIEELTLQSNSSYEDIATFLAKQWESIGLNVKVEVAPAGFLRERMSNGTVDFFRGSWIADYPDAENYMALFYGGYGAPPNYTRFNNPQFDELYNEALHQPSLTERQKFYQKLDQIIIEEAPVIPLYYDEVLRFTNKRVQGLTINPINLLNLKRVRLVK